MWVSPMSASKYPHLQLLRESTQVSIMVLSCPIRKLILVEAGYSVSVGWGWGRNDALHGILLFSFFLFFFLVVLGFELSAYTFSYSLSSFS
jgi:hypothetical protein